MVRASVAAAGTLAVLATVACRGPGSATPSSAGGLALEPYLLDKAEECLTIAWRTPTPRASEIRYGKTFAYELGRRTSPAGVQHRVELDSLESDTTYHYEVDHCFRGTLRTQRDDGERTFAVLSHTHGTEGPTHYPDELLVARIAETRPDFIAHTGDATYFCRYEDFRRFYFQPFAELLATTPVYIAPGNHDAGYPFIDDIGLSTFRELFPYSFGTSTSEDACYAVEQGSLRLLFLSYLSPLGPESSQRQWLGDRLTEDGWDFQGVVFGGSHPVFYDEPSLLDFLVESGADFVLRGDGVHPKALVQHHRDMPMFYVGTGGDRPHTFLHCRLREGMLALRQIRTDGVPGDMAVVNTRRRRSPVARVPMRRVVAERVVVGYIGELPEPLDSALVRGIQFDVRVADGKEGKVSAIVTPGDRELSSLIDGYATEQRPDVRGGNSLITMALPNRRIDTGQPFPIADVKLVFEGLGPADVTVSEVVLY